MWITATIDISLVPRPSPPPVCDSPSVFAYCKWSNTRGGEGPGNKANRYGAGGYCWCCSRLAGLQLPLPGDQQQSDENNGRTHNKTASKGTKGTCISKNPLLIAYSMLRLQSMASFPGSFPDSFSGSFPYSFPGSFPGSVPGSIPDSVPHDVTEKLREEPGNEANRGYINLIV